jgi:hypothetical protein
LENVVFLALRRKTNEIYYYTTPAGYEVDFYLPESHQLVQVAQNLGNGERVRSLSTREREVRALVDAMRSLNISQGLILSDANAEPVKENGFTITIRSVAEWLLESS